MSFNTEQNFKLREKFANQIRAQQRKKIFIEARKQMSQRIHKQKKAKEAQIQLLASFDYHIKEYQMLIATLNALEEQGESNTDFMEKQSDENQQDAKFQRSQIKNY